jgi:hypothetical protein
LILPEKSSTEDPQAWDSVFTRLGRPAKADEYVLNYADNSEKAKADLKWFREVAHKHGVSTQAAQGILDAFSASVKAQTDSRNAEIKSTMAQLDRELQVEWMDKYDNNVALARKAAAHFGLKDQMIAQMLQAGVGANDLKRMFFKIGSMLGEDKFVGSGDNAQSQGDFRPRSQQAAQNQIEAMIANKDWATRFRDGKLTVREQEEWRVLNHQAAGVVYRK